MAKTQFENSAQYLVLANGLFWKDPDSDFMLTWTAEVTERTLRNQNKPTEEHQVDMKNGRWWIAKEDIPVEDSEGNVTPVVGTRLEF